MSMPIFKPNYKKQIFFITNIRDFTSEGQPQIVQAHDVIQLLKSNQCVTEQYGNKTYKVLRFLLKTNGELVFAHEGAPGDIVPSHWQMTGVEDCLSAECFTAGNAFFSIEDDILQVINHKSGDFRPAFDSLLYLFPELIKNKISMANSLEIHQLDNSGAILDNHQIRYEEVLEYYHSAAQEKPGNSNTLDVPVAPHSGFAPDLNHVDFNVSANKLYDDVTFLNQSNNEQLTIGTQSQSIAMGSQNATLVQQLISSEEHRNNESNPHAQRNTFFYYNEEIAQQEHVFENNPRRYSM